MLNFCLIYCPRSFFNFFKKALININLYKVGLTKINIIFELLHVIFKKVYFLNLILYDYTVKIVKI